MIRTLADITPDPRNANKGTARGADLLGKSLRAYGAARSIVTDRNGRVIAGNKTLAQALALDLGVRVVETTGDELVVVQRTDLDATTDTKAQELAIADNRVAELDLDWDADVIRAMVDADVTLAPFFTDAELAKFLTDAGDQAPDQSGALVAGFGIVVECIDEAQQRNLLDELTRRGVTCRALIS